MVSGTDVYKIRNGTAALEALETRLEAGFSRGRLHVIANTIVDGDGNDAAATSYLVVFEREQAPSVIATAVYHDTLQKVDGGWKFVKRELHNDPNGKAAQ